MGNKSLIKLIFQVIKSTTLGGQVRELLEDTLNLDFCSRQTNIRMNIPENEYTKKVLEATGTCSPKPGNYVPGIAADPRQLGRATLQFSTRGPVSSSRSPVCI